MIEINNAGLYNGLFVVCKVCGVRAMLEAISDDAVSIKNIRGWLLFPFVMCPSCLDNAETRARVT